MSDLIDITAYPVKEVLPILLKDRSTKQNIIWATDVYISHGPGYSDKNHITPKLFMGENAVALKPRISKTLDEQRERTRKKAEVMTPVWLCNKMNNYADEQWFERKDVFNHENEDNTWTVTDEPVEFGDGLSWKKYVDSRRLEITCGEAPYLVSRYDTTTGELIVPPLLRIGILDRKLRIVNENTITEKDWLKWAERAVQSCYGYEYQGDNLLIARVNILLTFREYYVDRWNTEPEIKVLKRIAHIISWNIWQMDGLKDAVPLGKPYEEFHQISLSELFKPVNDEPKQEVVPCKIFNWRSNKSIYFKDCKKEVNSYEPKVI